MIKCKKKIGFWFDWSSGDVSVMMIGGGGSSCSRADHGIGITEANKAAVIDSDYTKDSPNNIEYDFGYDAMRSSTPSQTYSLNLWIRSVGLFPTFIFSCENVMLLVNYP